MALAALVLLATALLAERMAARSRARAELVRQTADLARRGARREHLVSLLKPSSADDPALVEEALLAAADASPARHGEEAAAAAEFLGVVGRRLDLLDSGTPEQRADAALVLGRLRARPAMSALIAALVREPGPRKLLLLQGLADLGDPACLPRFLQAAEHMPDADLPEAVRLMLRFGTAAYPWLLPIVNRRSGAFPPERLAELLKLAAERG